MRRDELILIVDDEPGARAILTEALDRAGFATLSADSGEAAIDLIEKAAPSLVVLDAVMPGLSGFDACRRIKERPENAHLPVIFTTGLAETEHVIEGLRAGGIDYITKPIVIDELIARIHVHLNAARLAMSARVALDVTGRSLIAADASGRLLWGTPQASQLLTTLFGSADGSPLLAAALAALAARQEDLVATSSIDADGGVLELACLGRAGPQEIYFRLSQPVEGAEAELLSTALSLTPREGEVLVWIARGKSNRDISEILNISPRTVNKHLEQIFTKLGVENRAAAAAIATRVSASRM